MPKLSDWKPSDPLQVMVFGQYKIGKSWGAYTFPRPVVLDFDKGIATARHPDFVKKYGMRQIYYEQFSEKNMKMGVPAGHSAFDEACKFFDEWMKPSGKWKNDPTGRDLFDTFIIDSGTTLSEFAQYKAVYVLGGMKLSKTHEAAVATGVLVPKMQDYGSERSLVEQFVDMVKTSGKNVVLICHEKHVTEGEGQNEHVTEIVPLLTGKSATAIPLKFDEVYNLRIKPKGTEMVRYLQTVPDSLRRVGSRYGIVNESVWEYDAIKKQIDAIHATQKVQSVLPPVTPTTK